MENSTSIQNLKEEQPSQNNSQEIDNIINQIEQDNSTVTQELPEQIPLQVPEENKATPIEEYEQQDNTYEAPSMYDIIYNELSYPVLVIVLFIILSFPQLDSLLCSYISFICSESGEINFFGILLKSLLMGILFYIFGKYVV